MKPITEYTTSKSKKVENCYNTQVKEIVKNVFMAQESVNKQKTTDQLKEMIISELKNYTHIDSRFKFVTTIGAILTHEHLMSTKEENRNICGYILNFMRSIEDNKNEDINLLINFEHTCFVIFLMLIDKVEINDYEQRNIFNYFLYALSNENILYNLKLLRVYYMMKNRNKFNPSSVLTNFEYEKTYNPTTYLDIRLSSDTNDILSMFSLTPSTKINSDIDILWFNWDKPNEQTILFTKIYEDIIKEIFKNKRNKMTIYKLFQYLTDKDIKPRINISDKVFYKMEYIHYLEDKYEVVKEIKEKFKSLSINSNTYVWNNIKNIEIGTTFVDKNNTKIIEGLGIDITLNHLFNSVMLAEPKKHKIVRKLTEYRIMPKGVITIEYSEGTIGFMRAVRNMDN